MVELRSKKHSAHPMNVESDGLVFETDGVQPLSPIDQGDQIGIIFFAFWVFFKLF
jgi:hypothetical protein